MQSWHQFAYLETQELSKQQLFHLSLGKRIVDLENAPSIQDAYTVKNILPSLQLLTFNGSEDAAPLAHGLRHFRNVVDLCTD